MMKTWQIKRLGDVLLIERGGSPRPIKKYITNSPNGLNWIKISDATASDKYIYETKEKITKEGLSKTRFVEEGDFILSNSMSFGRPYIMKTTGCIHDGWLVLKQKEYKYFETEFLYYLLSSPFIFNQFDGLAAGSTVRNLNIRLVSSVKVPIPPLPEQQRIVSILDHCFEAIDKAKANAEQNLQNAKELFESYLQGVFEDNDFKKYLWSDVLEIKNGRSYKSVIDDNGIYPIIGSAAKVMGYANDYICNEGTTIIGRKGTINSPIYINEKFWNVDTAFGLEANSGLDKRYLYYFCLSFDFTTMDKGSGRPSLVKSDLLRIKMPIPSIASQQSIVDKLDTFQEKTQELQNHYQKKISDLEELKKSILQKAFAGELKTEKMVEETPLAPISESVCCEAERI